MLIFTFKLQVGFQISDFFVLESDFAIVFFVVF